MSISNLFTPNNFNLYCNSIAVASAGSSQFYEETTVTNMKINHYNGATTQTDNLGSIHFIRIGKIVYCRIPNFTTTNVQSGAAESNFLYIWPLPAGFYNASNQVADIGLQWLQVPDANQVAPEVEIRYEPNINSVNSGVVNQPGFALITNYNANTSTRSNWPASTRFRTPEDIVFSYILD